jgi:hypothetical protein
MKVIAIDPGKITGLALCVDGVLKEVLSGNFWDAIDYIKWTPDAFVIVELPNNKHVWHPGAHNRGAIERTGVNVGSAIREAELLIEYLKRNNRQYKTVAPLGKVNAVHFKKITGWEGRTNQHKRDAAIMAFLHK